jgi:molybdopterin-guanine dinucleotide biosynthesis protein A
VRHVTGAIVAGGAAERFGGEPKGLRSVGGVRIIDRVASALRKVTPDLVLVANAPDAPQWLPGVSVRRDERSERGSIVAIHSAIAGAAAEDIVLVVAWDMPFASADLLALLVARVKDGAAAAIPDGPGGPEPFCAAYTRDLLGPIEFAIDRGAFRMSILAATLPNTTRVSQADVRRFGDPARLFFNVNDAADLETAERMSSAT